MGVHKMTKRAYYTEGFGMFFVPFLITQVMKGVALVLFLLVEFVAWEWNTAALYEICEFSALNIRITLLLGIVTSIIAFCSNYSAFKQKENYKC